MSHWLATLRLAINSNYGDSGFNGPKIWLTLTVLPVWQLKQFELAANKVLLPCWYVSICSVGQLYQFTSCGH